MFVVCASHHLVVFFSLHCIDMVSYLLLLFDSIDTRNHRMLLLLARVLGVTTPRSGRRCTSSLGSSVILLTQVLGDPPRSGWLLCCSSSLGSLVLLLLAQVLGDPPRSGPNSILGSGPLPDSKARFLGSRPWPPVLGSISRSHSLAVLRTSFLGFLEP